MRLFLLDMLMGILLSLALISFLISVFIFRGRREAGPLLLAISSLHGILGTLAHLMTTAGLVDVSPSIVAGAVVVWFTGSLLSVLLWRKRG